MRLHPRHALLPLMAACAQQPRPEPVASSPVWFVDEPSSAIRSAWWVTVRFAPAGSTVEGLPLAAIDPSWVAGTALRASLLPPAAAADPSSLADSSIRFAITADLNRDGVLDRAAVGVYRDRDRGQGRFLLFLTSDRGRWRPVQHETFPGEPGFSGLRLRGDTLFWFFCMECDHVALFKWADGRYAALPQDWDER